MIDVKILYVLHLNFYTFFLNIIKITKKLHILLKYITKSTLFAQIGLDKPDKLVHLYVTFLTYQNTMKNVTD